jgi:hypothetical protein
MPPTLVDDVLDGIFQNCTPTSLASISQASSRTYTLAIPCLLRKVELFQAPQTYFFLQFILHTPRSRLFAQGVAHYVVDLSLGYEVFHTISGMSRCHNQEITEGQPDYPCSRLAPALAAALIGMTNLQSFQIRSNTEGAMKHSPELAKTLLNLPFLHLLSLTDVWSDALNTLGDAVAGLEGARVSHITTLKLLVNTPWRRPTRAASSSFHRFISYLSPHLVNLNIDNIDLSGIMSHSTSSPVIFPMVLRLRISQGCVSLEELSCAFPNVTHLEVGPHYGGVPQRSHRLSFSLFTQLIVLEASVEHIETILNTPLPSGQQREMRVLKFTPDDGDRMTDIPTLLSRVKGLKSLDFNLATAESVEWWQECARGVPELKMLRISFDVNSPSDLDLIVRLPCPL